MGFRKAGLSVLLHVIPLFTNTLRWDPLRKDTPTLPLPLLNSFTTIWVHIIIIIITTHTVQFELLSKQRLRDSDSQLFLKSEIEAIQSNRDITTKSDKKSSLLKALSRERIV